MKNDGSNDFPNFEDFISSFNKDNSTSKNSSTNSSNFNNFNFDNLNGNNPFGNIDMNTILKMKQIMEGMNNSKDDPRSNLLLSLKPYLKPSRKQKVDQYIQFFKMSTIFENLNANNTSNSSTTSNNTGGEKTV